MGRWACVDVPALPLQLLLRREPAFAAFPAAVVEEDHPQARILWVNDAARERKVLPGQRYNAALSLARDLRAGVVAPREIAQGIEAIAARLRDFSPDVEPAAGEAGVFWLEGDGLGRLFDSASAWGRALGGALFDLGFAAAVAVGFTRYGTYAIAAASGLVAAGAPLRPNPVTVFRSPEDEQIAARDVPLARLQVEPSLRDDLAKLGVATLGQFLELPPLGLHMRFGEQAFRLHRLASGAAFAPLAPAAPAERLLAHRELEYAETDVTRLLFLVKEAADPLTARLAARHDAVAELRVTLALDDRSSRVEAVRPAQPTLDQAQLIDLLRLALERTPLTGRVEELTVEAIPAAVDAVQGALFAEAPRRDPDAADRALARLRAELGPQAVARATMREGHLPEASFLWEPLEHVARDAHPGIPPAEPPLVRRLAARPHELPPRPAVLRNDGWLIRSVEEGPVDRLTGPFVVSGGWWVRPVHREYHFAQTRRGDLLWVFYDRMRRRWYLHGQVE